MWRRFEEEEADQCVLREEFEPYSVVFDHQNGRLSQDNSYFGMFCAQIQWVSLVRPQALTMFRSFSMAYNRRAIADMADKWDVATEP